MVTRDDWDACLVLMTQTFLPEGSEPLVVLLISIVGVAEIGDTQGITCVLFITLTILLLTSTLFPLGGIKFPRQQSSALFG